MKVSPSHYLHLTTHRDPELEAASDAMRADHHEDLDTQVVSSRPLSASPPESPGPASNQTPLLTASLNAPPRSYYGGLNGNVRVKCPTDLSVTLTTKSRKTQNNTETQDNQHPHDSPSQGLSSQSSRQQSVFYSTLIKQLRHKTGDNKAGPAQQIHVVPVKIKKEKGPSSKSLPFRCPACNKRFQRHIAMNAHFQNEHISQAGAGGERSCKLCGTQAASLSAVRGHLRTIHNIDLDNPAKCLAEEPGAFSSSKYSVLEASLRAGASPDESEPSCSNIEMSSEAPSRSSSPLPAHSSSEQSPERQSLAPIKTMAETQAADDDLGQVEDLSLRRPAPASPVPWSNSHKRPRLSAREAESPSPTSCPSQSGRASPPASAGRFTCTHCCITYPNQTLYFLHKGFHSDSNPWRCNGCGHQATDMYDFMSHLFSAAHQ